MHDLLGVKVLFIGLTLSLVASAQEITFQAEKGNRRESATAVPLSDEILATVAIVGVKPESAQFEEGKTVDKERPAKTLIHDPVSRLTLLAREPEQKENHVVVGSALGLEPSDALYLDPENKEIVSRVVSWENRYGESVLPISLIRVHHPVDENPAPGSPLFDENGKLVALCHQATDEFGHGTYALPADVISRVQKDYLAQGKVVRCWIGIVMEVKNTVPIIMTVRPESPAATAGVQKDDILLSVGKHEVRTYSDTVNAFYYLVNGEETQVTVLRGTEVLTLNVVPEISPLMKNE